MKRPNTYRCGNPARWRASLDIEKKGKEIEKRHETGCASGNVRDGFGLDRMDQKQQRGQERDIPGLLRHGASEDLIDKKPGAEVEQQIQQMVAACACP